MKDKPTEFVKHIAADDIDDERTLKCLVLDELLNHVPKSAIVKTIAALEHSRKAFQNAASPGHVVWYPRHLQVEVMARRLFDNIVETVPKHNCQRCGELLDPSGVVWLELDATAVKYIKPGTLPCGHESQGGFPFGSACAKHANKPWKGN